MEWGYSTSLLHFFSYFMRLFRFLIFLVLLTLSNTGLSQWSFINNFKDLVTLIHFTDPADGHIGFVGTFNGMIWRSSDNGVTWVKYNSFWTTHPRSISFRDSLIGWGASLGSCFITSDGGVTWFNLSSTIPYNPYSVYYNKKMQTLFISSLIKSVCFSKDDGATWNFYKSPSTIATGGIAFSNGLNGVISNVPVPPSDYIVTQDGGQTWFPISIQLECWQPFGVPNTKIFYLVNEGNVNGDPSSIYRSIDGGLNWNKIFTYNTSMSYSLTGTMQIRSDGTLFIQTRRKGSEGILFSKDSGFSWIAMCGPHNYPDTKFYVDDNAIFAADSLGNLWVNHTGIGSSSIPQFSLNKISAPVLSNCQNFDTSLTFTFFDSCNGIQAKLVSASISGSNNFSFTSPSAIPRIIHPNDSLIISYNPQGQIPDTAELHLRFHLGWKDFDTSISLFGAGRIAKENVSFIPSLSQNSTEAGQSVNLSVTPNRMLGGRGLTSVSFDLNYIGDLLNFEGTASPDPSIQVTTGTVTHARRIETLPVTITGTDISLDSLKALAVIKFTAMLSDTVFTDITMTNLKLNGGDPDYKNCILSADNSNTDFTLHFVCGDTSIYNFLRTGKILNIISIRPNPAQDEIQLDVESPLGQDITIEMRNALGAKVFSALKNVNSGANSIYLNTKDLTGGMYFVRVSSANGAASESFVKIR